MTTRKGRVASDAGGGWEDVIPRRNASVFLRKSITSTKTKTCNTRVVGNNEIKLPYFFDEIHQKISKQEYHFEKIQFTKFGVDGRNGTPSSPCIFFLQSLLLFESCLCQLEVVRDEHI
jgi:hypothetical protein